MLEHNDIQLTNPSIVAATYLPLANARAGSALEREVEAERRTRLDAAAAAAALPRKAVNSRCLIVAS